MSIIVSSYSIKCTFVANIAYRLRMPIGWQGQENDHENQTNLNCCKCPNLHDYKMYKIMKFSVIITLLNSLFIFSIIASPIREWFNQSEEDVPIYDGRANDMSIVKFKNARFTILKENLIRCEYDLDATFDDSPSFAIINRHFPTPIYTKNIEGSTLYITTRILQLKYESLPPITKKSCKGGVHGKLGRNTIESMNFPSGTNTTSPAKCSELCETDEYCTAWSYDPTATKNNCFIHLHVGYVESKDGAIHGEMQLPTGFVQGSLSIAIRSSDGESFFNPDFNPGSRFTSSFVWYPGLMQHQNLNGTAESLDCYSTPEDCLRQSQDMHKPGLLSRDGWNVIYDQRTPRFEGQKFSISLPWQWVKKAKFQDLDDLYFHAYPDLNYKQALRDIAEISGFPALPPRSIFGIWWSMYDVYSEETLNSEVLEGYADHDLPLEVLNIDMDWHVTYVPEGCNGWGNFDYNITLFPDPVGYVNSLKSGNNPTSRPLTVLLNLHSQVGVDRCHLRYRRFAQAVGMDPESGETVRCDNSDSVYIDALYNIYLNASPLDTTDYWWTDFNGCGGEKYNPLLWSNIVYSSYQTHVLGKRSMLLTRNGGLGNQRYPIGFSGDALQHELALSWQIDKLAQSSNALFPYWSHDIGGHHRGRNNEGNANPKNVTASEMFARWIQFGVFSPFLRTHCDHCERRIWLYKYHFQEMRDAFWLRTGLIPYIYTAARETWDTGIGLARPLYYEWPMGYEEAYAPENEGTYFFGPSILVSPIKTFSGKVGGKVSHTVWLPPGRWVKWNGTKGDVKERALDILEGPRYYTAEYTTAEMPLFVKAGAIIPLQIKNALTIGSPTANIAWNIWPGLGNRLEEYTLYEDDGKSQIPTSDGPLRYSKKTAIVRLLQDRTVVEVVLQASTGWFTGKQNTRQQLVVLRDMLYERPDAVYINSRKFEEIKENDTGMGWWITKTQSPLSPAGSIVVSLSYMFETTANMVRIVFKKRIPE